MNRFSASLLVSLLLNGCNDSTPAAYSLPVTQGPPGAIQMNFDARPAVRLPARVAVLRSEAGHGGFRIGDGEVRHVAFKAKPHSGSVIEVPGQFVADVLGSNQPNWRRNHVPDGSSRGRYRRGVSRCPWPLSLM